MQGTVVFTQVVERPARKLIELIDEGNALNHCVGSYVDSYANGRTDILFLRRAEEPDKPWRTIEFSPTTGRMTARFPTATCRKRSPLRHLPPISAGWRNFKQKWTTRRARVR